MKQTIKSILSVIFIAMMVAGCATPHIVQEVKTSDKGLDCAALQSEIDEARRYETKAEDEKGFTGRNIIAGLLFWPAIVGTYYNANEAIDAAEDRQEHLVELWNEKGC